MTEETKYLRLGRDHSARAPLLLDTALARHAVLTGDRAPATRTLAELAVEDLTAALTSLTAPAQDDRTAGSGQGEPDAEVRAGEGALALALAFRFCFLAGPRTSTGGPSRRSKLPWPTRRPNRSSGTRWSPTCSSGPGCPSRDGSGPRPSGPRSGWS